MLTWISPNLKFSKPKKSKTCFGYQDVPLFIYLCNSREAYSACFSCQGHILTSKMGTPKSGFPLWLYTKIRVREAGI